MCIKLLPQYIYLYNCSTLSSPTSLKLGFVLNVSESDMLVKHARENLDVFIVTTINTLLLNPVPERKPLTTVLIVPVITWQHRTFVLTWSSTKWSFPWPQPKTFLFRKPKSRFTRNPVIHYLLSTLTLGLTTRTSSPNLPSPCVLSPPLLYSSRPTNSLFYKIMWVSPLVSLPLIRLPLEEKVC